MLMYVYLLLIVPLATSAANDEQNEVYKTNEEMEFKLEMDNFSDKIQTIINSDRKKQLIDELLSDENKRELLKKVGQWFQNGDITPTQLINIANMSFAGKFDTSPQFNMCIGKYTICTVEQCIIYAKNFDSYNPEIFQVSVFYK